MHTSARSAQGPLLVSMGIVAAVVLSGCIGESVDPLATPAATVGATIGGAVVSDEVFPVADANVSIEDGPSTFTDEEGRFTFKGLQPGSLTLHVTADGYEAGTQDVTVREGDVIEILITIAGVAGEAPFLRTIIFEGFSACTFSAVYSAGPFPPVGGGALPCVWGEQKTGTTVEVEDGWAAGVHEIAWESEEEMIFASSLDDGCQTRGEDDHDRCAFLGQGKSPIRAFARINDTEYAAKYAIDGKETWPGGPHTSHIIASYSGYLRGEVNQTAYPVCVQINRQFNVPEHWGCPFGIGYSTGLRFTMYHTTFYYQEPIDLEAFSAMPDA